MSYQKLNQIDEKNVKHTRVRLGDIVTAGTSVNCKLDILPPAAELCDMIFGMNVGSDFADINDCLYLQAQSNPLIIIISDYVLPTSRCPLQCDILSHE